MGDSVDAVDEFCIAAVLLLGAVELDALTDACCCFFFNAQSLIKWSPRLSINLDTTDEDKGLFSFNIYPGQQTGEGRMCVSSGMINWTDTSDSSSSSHWSPILTSHTPDSFLQTYQRNILETCYKIFI